MFDIFLIFAQNRDCGYTLEPPRRGGSNERPQFMFWSKNKKIMYVPANPSFFYMKLGFKGVYITWTCYRDVTQVTKFKLNQMNLKIYNFKPLLIFFSFAHFMSDLFGIPRDFFMLICSFKP